MTLPKITIRRVMARSAKVDGAFHPPGSYSFFPAVIAGIVVNANACTFPRDISPSCSSPYSAGNCGQVIEDPLDRSNETHKLIHVHLEVTAAMRAQQQLIGYWEVSLRESGDFPRVIGSCGGASVAVSDDGSDSAVGDVRDDDAECGDASRATIVGIPRDDSAGDSNACWDDGGD